MKKVSIIVLIYDVEKFLRQCLDSIINQTYKNLEIILSVSIGKDDCLAICQEYSKKDDRIVVASSMPQGIAKARNLGLQYVTGDYVAWVDGDDWIEETMIESLVTSLESRKADIAICGHYREYIDKSENVIAEIPTQMDKREFYKQLLNMNSFGLELWNKIFRKDCIVGISFPDTKEAEDRFWIYKVMRNAQCFAHTQTLEYHFRIRSDSCSRTEDNASISLSADKEMCKMILEDDKELKSWTNRFLFFSYYRAIYSDVEQGCFEYKKSKENLKEIKKCSKDIWCEKTCRKEDRLKAGLAIVSWRLLIIFMRMRKNILRRREKNDYNKDTV